MEGVIYRLFVYYFRTGYVRLYRVLGIPTLGVRHREKITPPFLFQFISMRTLCACAVQATLGYFLINIEFEFLLLVYKCLPGGTPCVIICILAPGGTPCACTTIVSPDTPTPPGMLDTTVGGPGAPGGSGCPPGPSRLDSMFCRACFVWFWPLGPSITCCGIPDKRKMNTQIFINLDSFLNSAFQSVRYVLQSFHLIH